jgi:hypothetical protein
MGHLVVSKRDDAEPSAGTRRNAARGVWSAMLACTLALQACSNNDNGPEPAPSGFVPGASTVFSVGNPAGKDEDPSLLLARDGSLCLAWFSDRDGGNPEIYVRRTIDGTDWTTPALRITNHPGGDFAPQLMQDDAGAIHLVWFRWTAFRVGQIMHRQTSGDCTQLAGATDDPVSNDPGVDDWVPSIAQAPDGALIVLWVSKTRATSANRNRLYVSRRAAGSAAWSAPSLVAGVAATGENDHLPFLLRTGATLTLAWVRHDGLNFEPWAAPLPKSDIWLATSSDGLAWGTPAKLTNEPAPVVHLYPGLYRRFDGSVWINWLSTRLDAVNQVPLLFEFPLAGAVPANLYPNGIERNALLSNALPGYSHRLSMTPVAGVYAGAWVDGQGNALDIALRYFGR